MGAGPAGAVASLVCVKQGLDTVLVERNSEIGGHTETKLDASPEGELSNIIDDLNLQIENKVYSSKWYPPSGNYFLLKSSSPEYYFKRGPGKDSFEVATVNNAETEGCNVHLGTRIEKVKEVMGNVDSVLAKKNGENIYIKPKIVVAADGANSLFHKFIYKRSENRKKIGYGVSGKNFSELESSNIYFDSELMRGGYFYIITGESGVSSACIVLDSNHTRKSAKEHFNEFLKKNPHVAEKVKSTTNTFGGEGSIFDIDRYVSQNVVYVGDAAGLVDPFFGYGMASAIVSSYHAGNIIMSALREDINLLQNYDSLIKEKFDKRLSYLYQRVFESLKNDDLDLIAEILNELDNKVEIDTILRMLSGHV
jgi:digeranylgeranylglycerophospholipid reductase